MPDTRPFERIQHSLESELMILDRFGKEAWQHWLSEKHRMYRGETRPCEINLAELAKKIE